MAVSRWKLSRNWIMHTALLEVETVKQDPSAGNEPVLTALAFKSLADSSQSLHLLHRYEVSLDRQYSRALNNLLKVRAARTAATIQDPPPGLPIETTGLRADAAEESETEPNQEFPNEPNLSPHSPAIKRPEQVVTARNPVEIIRRRPVSTSAPTPPAPNRTVPTPPRTK
jgi:hypothetical protein